MNLQQLRFVRETARRGFSLTQAAHALGTSQPALSRAILAGRFGHGERVRVSARADGEGLELSS